jgi:hypothetical protein
MATRSKTTKGKAVNTTTPAKVDGKSITLEITNDVETYRRSGIVSVEASGYAYLTVDKGTFHEYAICLGGAHTPIRYI